MNDEIKIYAMVISSMPIGEYDRRVLLLSQELGKISAFIRGGLRPRSPLLGAGRLFAFGCFTIYPGRSSFTVKNADIQEYFDFIASDPEAMCYAAYLAELAAYYARENVEDYSLLKLLYTAIRSLGNGRLSRPLIRYVYELKLMQIEGEAPEEPPVPVSNSACKAWQYVLESEIRSCFNFLLKPEDFRSFSQAVAQLRNEQIDGKFKSLTVLEEYLSLMASGPGK